MARDWVLNSLFNKELKIDICLGKPLLSSKMQRTESSVFFSVTGSFFCHNLRSVVALRGRSAVTLDLSFLHTGCLHWATSYGAYHCLT